MGQTQATLYRRRTRRVQPATQANVQRDQEHTSCPALVNTIGHIAINSAVEIREITERMQERITDTDLEVLSHRVDSMITSLQTNLKLSLVQSNPDIQRSFDMNIDRFVALFHDLMSKYRRHLEVHRNEIDEGCALISTAFDPRVAQSHVEYFLSRDTTTRGSQLLQSEQPSQEAQREPGADTKDHASMTFGASVGQMVLVQIAFDVADCKHAYDAKDRAVLPVFLGITTQLDTCKTADSKSATWVKIKVSFMVRVSRDDSASCTLTHRSPLESHSQVHRGMLKNSPKSFVVSSSLLYDGQLCASDRAAPVLRFEGPPPTRACQTGSDLVTMCVNTYRRSACESVEHNVMPGEEAPAVIAQRARSDGVGEFTKMPLEVDVDDGIQGSLPKALSLGEKLVSLQGCLPPPEPDADCQQTAHAPQLTSPEPVHTVRSNLLPVRLPPITCKVMAQDATSCCEPSFDNAPAGRCNVQGSYTVREGVTRGSCSGVRVLVVDDDVSSMKIIARALVRIPEVCVSTAGDGIEAVRVACSFMPHIVFMDLCMPRLAGLESASRIDAVYQMCDILPPKIYVVSGNVADVKSINSCRSAYGFVAQAFIKPVDVGTIRTLVRDYVSEVHARDRVRCL